MLLEESSHSCNVSSLRAKNIKIAPPLNNRNTSPSRSCR